MSLEEKRRAYQSFFLTNDAGKQFMITLSDLINAQHSKAEDTPELSRDYAQRAKGVREVMSHINSLTADRSKPKAGS